PIAGTDQSKSAINVPLLVGDRFIGSIAVENYEREDAFGDSELRLLSTVASSMGVALENARLFEETQRLFKESDQRAAELAVINRIQQGIAAELHFEAIVEIVGDTLQEVLGSEDLAIILYDEASGLLMYAYAVEHGERLEIDPVAPVPGGAFEQ